MRIRFEAEAYAGQPVIRYRTWLENRGLRRFSVAQANMLNWAFADAGRSYRAFRVNQ